VIHGAGSVQDPIARARVGDHRFAPMVGPHGDHYMWLCALRPSSLRLQGASGTGRDRRIRCNVPVPSGLLQPRRHRRRALDNIREAIELCLEDMQAHGEVIPDPSRVLVGSVVVTRASRRLRTESCRPSPRRVPPDPLLCRWVTLVTFPRAIGRSRGSDDDKFLVCAVAGAAEWLVSADRDLLS
jgi:hypothetical protein